MRPRVALLAVLILAAAVSRSRSLGVAYQQFGNDCDNALRAAVEPD